MSFSKRLNLVIYRFKEKGLEIFLVNNEDLEGAEWDLPKRDQKEDLNKPNLVEDEVIELDPFVQATGEEEEAWAVEGDWHDIPSLKSMLFEDAMQLKDKIKDMEKGTFFKIKEALKRVLPHQYEFLKELRDILTDRNSLKDL